MRTRDTFIKVCLTEDEAERLKAYANLCGLTQSAFLRILIQGRRAQPNPPSEFWEMLNTLYEIHSILQSSDEQQKLEAFILRLQAAVTLPRKAVQCGDDEDMGG